VQADLAVAAGATGAGIKVGVIDSGVYVGHADLAGVAITGEPYLGGNDPRNWNRDYYSHGTHVVGTLAAVDNNFGVLGVSPGSVVLHLVKVFGDGGSWIYSSDTLAAARSAAAKGAKIVSMSLGGTGRSRTEDAGMADLYNRGVLLVAAAGNDGNTDTSYPAGYDSVISVAAIDSTKAVASFSQQNADVELAAPGKSVLSTVSYIDTTFVLSGADSFDALHMEFAARGTASAPLVYGGIGRTGDRSWSGKVVLLDRGTNTFYEKIRNVQRSGGVACIIANNEAGELSGTLGEGNTSTIPAVGITQADGATLASRVGSTVTVSTNVQNDATAYEEFDGTSMATPHVSGVAALIWSKYRGATNVQVRQALVGTAEDLGAGGRDSVFGYGLVRAKAALDALAAMNPGPAPTDTTAPIISNLNVANPRPGILEFTWTTNEPASSDVELDGYASLEGTLTQSHVRTFRVLRGSHIYRVTSTDAAGNATTTDIATTSL
jgi:serine protease